MFGVKNKDNTTPKLKGKDFDFFNDGSGGLSIAIVGSENDSDKNAPPKNVVLKTGNKIKIQNIYKALCKFALSVVDSNQMVYFDRTVDWLKNKIEASSLPKIAVLNSYSFFTRRPKLTLFVR
ncbi:MAG: hypothetical protein MZV65_16995, partial [Chromatiales bacterium]|nr:hypothetical protein [Chromatiales bacterium]